MSSPKNSNNIEWISYDKCHDYGMRYLDNNIQKYSTNESEVYLAMQDEKILAFSIFNNNQFAQLVELGNAGGVKNIGYKVNESILDSFACFCRENDFQRSSSLFPLGLVSGYRVSRLPDLVPEHAFSLGDFVIVRLAGGTLACFPFISNGKMPEILSNTLTSITLNIEDTYSVLVQKTKASEYFSIPLVIPIIQVEALDFSLLPFSCHSSSTELLSLFEEDATIKYGNNLFCKNGEQIHALFSEKSGKLAWGNPEEFNDNDIIDLLSEIDPFGSLKILQTETSPFLYQEKSWKHASDSWTNVLTEDEICLQQKSTPGGKTEEWRLYSLSGEVYATGIGTKSGIIKLYQESPVIGKDPYTWAITRLAAMLRFAYVNCKPDSDIIPANVLRHIINPSNNSASFSTSAGLRADLVENKMHFLGGDRAWKGTARIHKQTIESLVLPFPFLPDINLLKALKSVGENGFHLSPSIAARLAPLGLVKVNNRYTDISSVSSWLFADTYLFRQFELDIRLTDYNFDDDFDSLFPESATWTLYIHGLIADAPVKVGVMSFKADRIVVNFLDDPKLEIPKKSLLRSLEKRYGYTTITNSGLFVSGEAVKQHGFIWRWDGHVLTGSGKGGRLKWTKKDDSLFCNGTALKQKVFESFLSFKKCILSELD